MLTLLENYEKYTIKRKANEVAPEFIKLFLEFILILVNL